MSDILMKARLMRTFLFLLLYSAVALTAVEALAAEALTVKVKGIKKLSNGKQQAILIVTNHTKDRAVTAIALDARCKVNGQKKHWETSKAKDGKMPLKKPLPPRKRMEVPFTLPVPTGAKVTDFTVSIPAYSYAKVKPRVQQAEEVELPRAEQSRAASGGSANREVSVKVIAVTPTPGSDIFKVDIIIDIISNSDSRRLVRLDDFTLVYEVRDYNGRWQSRRSRYGNLKVNIPSLGNEKRKFTVETLSSAAYGATKIVRNIRVSTTPRFAAPPQKKKEGGRRVIVIE